jgi:hypothetical protein
MTTQEEAAEQLRVIRSVMERAVIYRALSGETALIGGAAALAAAWLSEARHSWHWAQWWLGGLAAVIAFNAFQIYRIKLASDRSFWSPGLRIALRGAIPSLIAGGFLGLIFVRGDQVRPAACMWILHYGLALLAIREFAPKSMQWLGWAFVIFGVTSLAGVSGIVDSLTSLMGNLNGSRLMAIAFGGFHLIYGALIVTTAGREHGNA